ncbi:ATP-binding protein [Saccharopolyspora sp. NPDC047091]|uniref:ATP-binding protein n=1 Tax=Saccharopolyspora sp. NPDC047091 TaxID=3155924 RepID=UPI003405303B
MSAPQPARGERTAPPPRSGSAPAESVVEVRVAADASQLSVLRAVTGDLAMRADFDVDSIADLRLAVDEACSSLIRLAADGRQLVCRFETDEVGLHVSAAVGSDRGQGAREDTFSWRVLSALTDSVSTSVESDADSGTGHLVRIDLTKGRTHE